ncbi:MAG: DEAD/DEAH box helicase [Patescibacteria group bacterium]
MKIKNVRTWKKKINITEAAVSDESGSVRAVWFNQPYLADTLKIGDLINLSGKVVVQKSGLFFSHPVCEIARGGKEASHTGRLVPVYAITEGLTSRWLRFIIKPLLTLAGTVSEYLPAELKISRNLPDLAEALKEIHFPKNAASAERARSRFAFEELFFLQLRALAAKQKLKKERAPEIPPDIAALKKFVAGLPFKLTDAQREAAWEILRDLAKPSPMNRLLNGDVGSGKTVVAALAAFSCVLNGYQAAFMAPTEILANQHFEEISKLCGKIAGMKIGLLTAKIAKLGGGEIKKSELLEKTERGKSESSSGLTRLFKKT